MSSERDEHAELLARFQRMKVGVTPAAPSPAVPAPAPTSPSPSSATSGGPNATDSSKEDKVTISVVDLVLEERMRRLRGGDKPSLRLPTPTSSSPPPFLLPARPQSEADQFDELMNEISDEVSLSAKASSGSAGDALSLRLNKLKGKDRSGKPTPTETELAERFKKITGETAIVSSSPAGPLFPAFDRPMSEEDEITALLFQAAEAAKLEEKEEKQKEEKKKVEEEKKRMEEEKKEANGGEEKVEDGGETKTGKTAPPNPTEDEQIRALLAYYEKKEGRGRGASSSSSSSSTSSSDSEY